MLRPSGLASTLAATRALAAPMVVLGQPGVLARTAPTAAAVAEAKVVAARLQRAAAGHVVQAVQEATAMLLYYTGRRKGTKEKVMAAEHWAFIRNGVVMNVVQIGTANFVNPHATLNVIEGIKNYLAANKIKDVNDIIGTFRP